MATAAHLGGQLTQVLGQGWGRLNQQVVLLRMTRDEGWLDCTVVNPLEDPVR